MNMITRALVLAPLSAGILGGALGIASTAAADVAVEQTSGSYSMVATPNTKAPSHTMGRGSWHTGSDIRAQMGR